MSARKTSLELRNERDRAVFRDELGDFLPDRIFDAHVHLFDATIFKPDAVLPAKSCYRKFGGVFPLEQYLSWAEEWLPDREMHLNSFGHPATDVDRDAAARYSGSIADNRRVFGMTLVSPDDSPAVVAERLDRHRLIGCKPYLNFVSGKPPAEVTIEDMLPAGQMDLAEARGLPITLHIPRNERLADAWNQRQMVEVCRRYPNAKFIFAHIGRAYYLQNVIDQLEGIAAFPNAFLDTAMVNHEGVLEYTLRHFPRERILFGSDAPIALLRGKSVEINNQYAYLMGEDYAIGTSIFDAGHAVEFTTFFYEQLRGILRASRQVGLTGREIENLFFRNAHKVFTEAAVRRYGQAAGSPASKGPPPRHESLTGAGA